MEQYIQVFKCLGAALENSSCATFSNLCFKPKQIQCFELLLKGHDVVAVLPTGYGKSLIFHLLPWVLPIKTIGESNLVLVVCPLSSIMNDQISVLKQQGIRAASLPNLFNGKDDDVSSLFPSSRPKSDDLEVNFSKAILEADIDILFGHPESFLSVHGRELLKSPIYKKKVVACAVDEAHCINIW